MRVVIAGGHGQIALRLERQLAEAGHQAVGLVRNPDHVPDLEKVGARGVVLDLEQASAADVAAVVSGADAVVFAAGGGPGSGAWCIPEPGGRSRPRPSRRDLRSLLRVRGKSELH